MAGRFEDRTHWRQRSWRDVMTIYRGGGFGNRDARRDSMLVARVPPPADMRPPREGTAVTWIGHATCLVQMAGRSFLTDPVFALRLPGLIPRLTPPGVPWERLPHIDAIIISHDHYDHLDTGTIKRLPRDTPVFAPLGTDKWFHRRGFSRVTVLDWWEEASLGDVRLTLVPVQHWCQRGIFDRNDRLWGGWVLEAAGSPSVFFAGDSGYFLGFQEIGTRLSPDIAILPVGAYHPRWFMQPMHMSPEEAVQACRDVGASQMVTIHWGTFALSSEPFMEPVERTRAAWAAAGLAREDLWDLALGERRASARPRRRKRLPAPFVPSVIRCAGDSRCGRSSP